MDNNPQIQINNFDCITRTHLIKMIFIYNAVLQGWSVKQNIDGSYEFSKPRRRSDPPVEFGNYLCTFIRHNMSLERLANDNI